MAGTVLVRVPEDLWPSRRDWRGRVAALHVQAGDLVSRGQVVAEVEIEKAILEVESPVSGRVVMVYAGVGDEVGPGDPLIEVEAVEG